MSTVKCNEIFNQNKQIKWRFLFQKLEITNISIILYFK